MPRTGRPKGSTPPKTILNLRIEEELLDAIRRKAESEGFTTAALIRFVMRKYVKDLIKKP